MANWIRSPVIAAFDDVLPTQIYLWPPKKMLNKPKRQICIYFIPGNPGLCSFYVPFLENLYQSLSSENIQVSILGVSFAGFPPNMPTERFITLAEQVEHKIRIFKRISSDCNSEEKQPWLQFYDKPEFIVMGHSLGAYCAVEVLKQCSASISAVYYLFPAFAHIAKSRKGSHLVHFSGLSFMPKVISYLALALHFFLPRPWIRTLVSKTTGLSNPGLDIAVEEVLHPRTVETIIGLAFEEMYCIGNLEDDFWETYGKKCLCYFGSDDPWMLNEIRDEIMQKHKSHGVFVKCTDNIPHAFPLRHSDAMASKITEFITTNRPS